MNANDRPIIIIKKRAKSHGGHHGGSWKVAYADFVTAMMAFFLVMWILGLNADTRKAIAAYFNDPTGMMKTHAGGNRPNMVTREATSGRASIMPLHTAIANAMRQHEEFKEAKKSLEKLISRRPEFAGFQKHVDITVTTDGLRIELLESERGLFFESGSAALKPETTKLLQLIGSELSRLHNPIVVEGHTDAQAYSGGAAAGYSNWELSVDRANSARRAMAPTLRNDQVAEVRGYADRRLRYPDDPFRFSNRRVSILVPYTPDQDGNPTHQVGLSESGSAVTSPVPGIAPAVPSILGDH